VTNPLAAGSLSGKNVLVTGSSRGIGADTIRYFAGAGANVVINYRNKEARAVKLADEVRALGVQALVVGADLTDPASVAAMAEDYAMQLNRDAQVSVVEHALPLLRRGSRIVFVTSHQAHFIRTTPTMPEYVPVATSKRAGEDALRAKQDQFDAAGVEFVVVSGDMIEGTITATLLERANPGAISSRKESAGRLYNVGEFAAEVASAAVDPIPENHTRYVGDTSDFIAE
jgi:NAD(P)-dependent dehydrogenase (short-subunit alcohol dehydrogenase family)